MNFFEKIKSAVRPEEGRVEALAKVTGAGKYSAEYEIPGIRYAVVVSSTVASGKLNSLDIERARQVDGVIDILSYWNKITLDPWSDEAKRKEARAGLPVFHTDSVYYYGQPIALVVADSLENATYAASLIKGNYSTESFAVDFDKEQVNALLQNSGKERGSIDAWANAPFKVEEEYRIAAEVHNPMEMHATIAHWEAGDQLKLYDKSQGVMNVQRTIARLFGLSNGNVQVISEFVGGGFGSGLRVWTNTIMAAMAAKMVGSPVKLVLTRPQMFYMTGYRPESWQKIKIGADANGILLGAHHQARHSTSVYESFGEGITRVTRLVYRLNNLKTESATVPLHLSTPTWMRGPGDCTGSFAVESALDELSYQLKMDPVQLRLQNISLDKEMDSGKPWSTHFLDECIKKGAEQIGWSQRKSQPGLMDDGEWRTGYGMAVGMWTAGRGNASAGIEMKKDGSFTIKTAMTDIGTGTGTGMQNMAHSFTGISKEKISVELGQSDLPPAGSQGGSTGLSSISGAVKAVSIALKERLAEYAANQNEVYSKAKADDIILTDSGIAFQKSGQHFISYESLWDKNNLTTLEVEASSGPGAEREKFAFCSSAAHFCKLRVNKLTGKVKIDRVVTVADGGKIINERPAANQMSGAVVGGIGMALMEEQPVDVRYGALVGNDLAGYHFPVNADAPIVEVSFIDKPDPNINPAGSKGLGEVGIIGCAAAISNAIYNATGRRIRELPITPDKLV